MTANSISESERKKLAKKEYMKDYYRANKERINKKHKEWLASNKEQVLEKSKEYRHSKKGMVKDIYNHQKQNSTRRGHAAPDYGLEELREWMFSQPNFDDLYQGWVSSGFDKMQVPSCDRLNDYKPYSFDNMQLTTWKKNKLRGHADKKAGINNKNSKVVKQFTKEGAIVAEHHSARHANRVTGVDRGDIGNCCNGKLKSAGGFVWRFA